MRNIVSPLDGFLSPFGRRSGEVIDPFASLMSTLLSGSTQLIAHPLAYGSMFQDRAGTTPVTAPGQLVGMVLDHGVTGSAPVLGPELVTNGDFATDTDWIKTDASITISGGTASFSSTPTGQNIAQSLTLTVGATYEISFDVLNRTAGGVRIEGINAFIPSAGGVSADGTYTFYAVASESGSSFRIRGLGTTTLDIDNISVRELPGYHATAISDAARGVYREEGGIRYIEYNGVNTAYATPALPAPLVDKAQVFAGVRKLSDAAATMLAELGPLASSNNGSFYLTPTNSAGFGTVNFLSRGTSFVQAFQNGNTAPLTSVLTGIGDISGDLATLRIDGTQVAQSTAEQGTGNYNPSGTYPLYFGTRAGTTLFFDGRHYDTLGPITRFSAANATTEQIEAAEAYYTARVI